MKKIFTEPELRFIEFSVADIIATSPMGNDYGDDGLALPMV